jgi:hypothetical protein
MFVFQCPRLNGDEKKIKGREGKEAVEILARPYCRQFPLFLPALQIISSSFWIGVESLLRQQDKTMGQ